jgi:large subunit ribosomal protein L35
VPKIKTHKVTAKRFKLTGSGKLVRSKGHKSHLRRNRSKRAKRLYERMLEVDTPGEIKRIKRLLPYISKHSG